MLNLVCEFCEGAYQRKQRQRFCGLVCRARYTATYRRGENHPTFKGRLETTDGYIRVWRPGHPLASKQGYVQEHRLALYETGIELPPTYHVHHLNHDKSDNRLENLVALTASEHRKEHQQPGSLIKNQYGVSTVGTDEEKRERRKTRNARRYRAVVV